MSDSSPAHPPTVPAAGAAYPRHAARTRNFRLGAPRQVSVTADGERVVLVRSSTGTDPVNRLVVVDVGPDGLVERVVADPADLLATADEDLPAAERARRERMRESTSGVTGYSLDRDGRVAAFVLSGRLHLVDLMPGGATPRALAASEGAVDPRLSPDGRWVAYVSERELRLHDVESGADRSLCSPESDTVTWGLADFIAAEEHDRHRGMWWAPDSSALLVERFDDAPVGLWWLSDPAHPERPPTPHRYPAAGTPNAAVSLHLVSTDGTVRDLVWDHADFPYVTSVVWTADGPALVTVMSRDQRRTRLLALDATAANFSVLREDHDPAWIDVIPGLPRWTHDGRLARTVEDVDTDTRRLVLDEVAVTPPGAQVQGLLEATADRLYLSVAVDPIERAPWVVEADGTARPLETTGEGRSEEEPRGSGARQLGVHSVAAGGDTLVVASATLDSLGTRWTVWHGGHEVGELASHAETPAVRPRVTVLRAGEREVVTAVLFPSDHVPGSARLPVILAPYGGPHHSEVLASASAFASDQWLADQGFAVVVADGRGTPGRGPGWERAVLRDFGSPTLDDQIAALDAVAAAYPDDVDTGRVGITGWSFGGWLSAYAVLRRPDRFHAAVAGAPVTDWQLYDTGYTERYLGMPDTDAEAYERNSLLPLAPGLRRPLLLIHGLVDDNVVVAHTLLLSGALLAAGRPHTVLPLTGITHMAAEETVAENLLLAQVDFLRRALEAVEPL